MTNEEIVLKIKTGYSVADNMRLLYEKNLPIIKSICKRYAFSEPLEDLLQEAYFGLSEAVQHYESSENVKFMTYAVYWIRVSITRYLAKYGSVLRLSNQKIKQIYMYKKIIEKYIMCLGRMPTDTEVAGIMQVSEKTIQDIKLCAEGVSSLDAPLQVESEDITLCDTVKADFNMEEDVIDNLCNEQLKNELWDIVERYTDMVENNIIREFYINRKSISKIASEMGMSINDVRKLKQSGQKKLRYGKAKKEMLIQYDLLDSCLFRTGLKSYKEHDFTSIVERLAVSRVSYSN